MFDNLFTSSLAVWGGLIGGMIALPILIHLINLMRHQTVQWAAMEFLLKSYKKNRNWVWLKQLLLLLSRIAALLLALFMLAQIGCDDDRISRLLGGATTHHYVLLDDSFSMSDHGSGGSAFDQARNTLSLISSRAKNRQNQLFSLVRYSLARPSTADPGFDTEATNTDPDNGEADSIGQMADLNGELVDNLFEQRIEDVKARLTVSKLSVGLNDSLKMVAQLIEERENENSIVYIISDFRQRDWENPTEYDSALMQIHSHGAAVEMINCVKSVRQNLALTRLQPVGNVRVAGTPLMMQLTVKNCSDSMAEKVQVKLGSFAFPQPTSSTVPADVQADFSEIPAVFIQSIAPGESETRSFPVYFGTTGKHVVMASLPDDAIATDNERWNATEFSTGANVLLIDEAEQLHSRFISLALSPGGMTGIIPEFRTKDFLRDCSLDTLLGYDVVFLMDVDSLDESAIKQLEAFALEGGGVAFFLGPNTNLDAYNTSLYREGAGIFPIPLERSIKIPELLDHRMPDFAPSEHPMFAPVLGGKNSLLDLVQISRVIQPPIQWSANGDSGVTVLASVRGMESWPLVVEKSFGKGRVIAVTTTAGPIWNNWTRNATFPPIMLLMQDYLAAGKYTTEQRVVGTPIKISVTSDTYSPNLTVIAPGGGEGSRLISQTKMGISASSSDQLMTTIGKRRFAELTRATDLPGIYDVWLRRTDSTQQVERYTLNVDTTESEMALVDRQKLLAELSSSKPTFVDWDQFNPEPKQKPASSLSQLLLFLLVSILMVEQVLAYSTSYHQRR